MTVPRVLVTGFDPFGDFGINTSQLVVEHLARTAFDGLALDTEILPTAYARSFAPIARRLAADPPHAVLMFGVAGSVDRFSLETAAANVRSTGTPDNDGLTPDDPSIDPQGPAALPTTADAGALLASLHARGIDAHLSDDAGDYLCNFTYYKLLRRIDAYDSRMPALFVHVPDLSGSEESASLARLRDDAAALLGLFADLVPDRETRTV